MPGTGGTGLTIKSTWSHPFATPVEVWVHEPVDCVFIDLSKIDEDNCPRDPSYPNDKNKFGVIYSKVPVYIMGVPKVPVNIVCEEDVYIGPINSSMLNWKLELETPSKDYGEDDKDLCPVGIIGKKVVYFDETFAPQIPAPTPSSTARINNNCFVSIDHYTTIGKYLKLNKVSIFHPLIKDVTVPFDDQRYNYATIAPRSYFLKLGRTVTGGVKRGTNTPLASAGTATGGTSFDSHIKYIGNLYTCYDSAIVTATAGDKVKSQWDGDKTYVYASSFRYWAKDQPLTSGPPPHMPLDLRSEWWQNGNIASGEAFFTELQNVLGRNLPYSAELSNSITDLLTALENQ